MRSLLPDGYSTVRACLTLQEASACWHRNVGREVIPTEVFDVPSTEDEIREGLATSKNEVASAQVLLNALDSQAA